MYLQPSERYCDQLLRLNFFVLKMRNEPKELSNLESHLISIFGYFTETFLHEFLVQIKDAKGMEQVFQCQSFNYVAASKSCELHDLIAVPDPKNLKLKPETGTSYNQIICLPGYFEDSFTYL